MPNEPYLDASVQWRINTGKLDFKERGYRSTVEEIVSAGLATDVVGLISAGKEADVYLGRYNDAEIAVKVYRFYQTSHRSGGPIKVDSMGWLAAHEFDMTFQAWRGGAPVPTPARRVENMFSMRYLGDGAGPAPRLKDLKLEKPEKTLREVLDGIETLVKAGVVHADLSAFNILLFQEKPWFIDFSEAIRVDRTGMAPWMRLTKATEILTRGIEAIKTYFNKYDLDIDTEEFVTRLVDSQDKFGVLR